VYTHWIEPDWLDVTRTEIDIPGLPPALDGLIIAQLTDFHLERHPGRRSAALRAVEVVNASRPDIVVLTGDYLAERKSLRAFEDLLAALRVRPAYAVFGNHDYRFGPAIRRGLERAFAEHGVTLLDNRSVAYECRGHRLWFVGVGDAYTSHDRLGEALAGLCPEMEPRILLSHYPDLLHDISPAGFALVLAGHTHGAQVALPVLSARALRRSDTTFKKGRYEIAGTPLYVCRGLGTSRLRLRFRVRPELATFVLRAAPARPGAHSPAGFDEIAPPPG
jgi:predicted MPP superfamily phosphohydrolase